MALQGTASAGRVSVVTIVRNRSRHLGRLIDGLARSDTSPHELIVVDMGDEPVSIPALPFPAQRVSLATSKLLLAAARNRGAEAASGEHLLFLDVDCIPRRNLVGVMQDALGDDDALICPEVTYLGPDAADVAGDEALDARAVPHPLRQFPEAGLREQRNAGLFWSLAFGIRRPRFFSLGGFDESYEGYGAEDTDFAFRAREAGVPLLFAGGTGAYHQYHGVISPPLQHLSDIVANANRFHRRWGHWPMQGWLDQFATLGLVVFDETGLREVRQPTAEEFKAATQPPSVYF